MKKFKKEYKYLFWCLIFSTLLAVIYYIIHTICFHDSNLRLLIPALVVWLICFISSKTFSKHPEITKAASAVLITITIGCFQIFGYLFAFAIFSALSFPPTYETPYKYEEALSSSNKPTCIKHFPKEIPNGAKNVRFLKRTNNWFGSEYVYLKFDIDKQYIEKELNNYNFKYKETVEADNAHPSLFRHHSNILGEMAVSYEKRGDYVFYIIHDYKSETPPQNSFLYYYGIAVNSSKTNIIYFYENPD